MTYCIKIRQIFGIIGMVTSIMMLKAKRNFDLVMNSVHHRFSEYLPGEFKLHWVPEEVWITFAICNGIQFVMGAFLIGGAANVRMYECSYGILS